MANTIVGVVGQTSSIVGTISRGNLGNSVPSGASNTTAQASDILSGKTAYSVSNNTLTRISGTMTDRSSTRVFRINDAQGTVLPSGYYNSTEISIDENSFSALQPQNIRQGYSILGVDGTMNPSSGIITPTTANASEIVSGKTAVLNGALTTGTMVDRGSGSQTITTLNESVSIDAGYYDGTGSVSIDSSERAKIIGDNIREGVVILGVTGTLESGSGTTPDIGSVDDPVITIGQPTGTGSDRYVAVSAETTYHAGLIGDGTATSQSINIRAYDIEDYENPVIISESRTANVSGYRNAVVSEASVDSPSALFSKTRDLQTTTHLTANITPRRKVNSAGWIASGTTNGNVISIQARDLEVDGNGNPQVLDITANTSPGSQLDVEDYRYVTVNVSGGSGDHSPSISVSNDGTVTATCGGTSTTHTLSSSDDTDFKAANIKTGTNIFGVTGSFTSDANATAADLRSSKTAYVNGSKITGSMTEHTTMSSNVTVTSKSGNSIPAGYYNGTPKAVIGSTDSSNLIATNIRKNVTILGVTGTLEEGSSMPLTPVEPISTENSKYIYGGPTIVGQRANGHIYDISDSTLVVSKYAVTQDTLIYVDAWAYDTSDGLGAYLSFYDSNDVNIARTTRSAEEGSTTSTAVAYDKKVISVPLNAAYVYVAGSTASGRKAPAVYVGTPSGSGIDPSDATAAASDILAGKTAYIGGEAQGNPTAGTMTNNGAVSATIDVRSGHTSYTVPAGYHNGSGTVSLTTETKTITPVESSQTVTPTDGKVLSSVTVNPIPSTYGKVTNATASASTILSGYKAVVKDANGNAELVTGTYTGGGGGVATVYKDTTGHISTSTYGQDVASISVDPGTYDIYASCSACSTSTQSRTAKVNVKIDGATPTSEGLSYTFTGVSAPSPKAHTIVAQNVSVNSTIGVHLSVSHATCRAILSSLIAIKVG